MDLDLWATAAASRWALLSPGCACPGLLQGEGKGVLSGDRCWDWNPTHRACSLLDLRWYLGLSYLVPQGLPSFCPAAEVSAQKKVCSL